MKCTLTCHNRHKARSAVLSIQSKGCWFNPQSVKFFFRLLINLFDRNATLPEHPAITILEVQWSSWSVRNRWVEIIIITKVRPRRDRTQFGMHIIHLRKMHCNFRPCATFRIRDGSRPRQSKWAPRWRKLLWLSECTGYYCYRFSVVAVFLCRFETRAPGNSGLDRSCPDH